jgi:predicted transcriptional regulator
LPVVFAVPSCGDHALPGNPAFFERSVMQIVMRNFRDSPPEPDTDTRRLIQQLLVSEYLNESQGGLPFGWARDCFRWRNVRAHARVCIANAIHEEVAMKTASLPPLRVAPELRQSAEAALRDGESLSGLMEQSLRSEVNRRRTQAEFIARGLAARDEDKRTGVYYSKEESLAALDAILGHHKPGTR